MIIVTGGAGFIGSNIVHGLNEQGYEDILVVDNLTNGKKFINLVGAKITDYVHKEDFRMALLAGDYDHHPIEGIFHQGACSATTEWDGRYMMDNNYEVSKELLHFALERKIPFLYASSASVYGAGPTFIEAPEYEKPLNVYGYSKYLFDQYVRKILPKAASLVVGFRYFNVYGPREQHKGDMASVAFKLHLQLLRGENPKLFGAYEGYEAGMQSRDFVYVKDAVKANLWFWQKGKSGIYNLGPGQAEPFKAIAQAVIDFHGKGEIEYIPFPEHLKGAYQSYTQADVTKLREAGYQEPFYSVAEGVADYLQWLSENPQVVEFAQG